MNFSRQFYGLVFLILLPIGLTVVADEETKEIVRMEEVVVTARNVSKGLLKYRSPFRRSAGRDLTLYARRVWMSVSCRTAHRVCR